MDYKSEPEISISSDSSSISLSFSGVGLGSAVAVPDGFSGHSPREEAIVRPGSCEGDDAINDKATEIWANLRAKAWLVDVLAVDGNLL